MGTKKISDSNMLGIFANSLELSNYEYTLKRQTRDEDEEEDEEKDEDQDDRTKRINKKVDQINIQCEDPSALETDEVRFQRVCAACTELASDLTHARGSHGTPEWMEQRVHEVVEGQKGIKEVRVLDSDKLQELGMNLFYNVGKGAVVPPRCVMVHYQGDPSRDEVDLALVGKGVTFDTGGLNLKKQTMEHMFADKAGSCAVIGALKGTLELGTKKNILFACGFAENAVGSRVYKPGDIIKGMNGLAVEIGNTDAEGRLVLADTFTYVQYEFKPKKMVDLATLTGACLVALGNETA